METKGLTPEQRAALIKARLWCWLYNVWVTLKELAGRRNTGPAKPTITSIPVGACGTEEQEFCKKGAFGLPHVECRYGCMAATRKIIAITATDSEHRIVKGFWPIWVEEKQDGE